MWRNGASRDLSDSRVPDVSIAVGTFGSPITRVREDIGVAGVPTVGKKLRGRNGDIALGFAVGAIKVLGCEDVEDVVDFNDMRVRETLGDDESGKVCQVLRGTN